MNLGLHCGANGSQQNRGTASLNGRERNRQEQNSGQLQPLGWFMLFRPGMPLLRLEMGGLT